MGLYLNKAAADLHRFITKTGGANKIRELLPDELIVVSNLSDTIHKMNLCITELVLIRYVISYLGIKDLAWVKNNIQRIICSLQKQRDLVCSTRHAFSAIKPNEEESQAIKGLTKDVNDRICFLNSIPIPENIRLMPIHDYLELVGEDSFVKEVKKWFPTYHDIIVSEQNGSMNKYVSYIMKTLESVGKADAYKARLSGYVCAARQRNEKIIAEKKEERENNAKNDALNGMLLFKDLFFRSIRELSGNEKIGTSGKGIRAVLNQGARGKMIVLCCYSFKHEFVFRYMNNDGTMARKFGRTIGFYETYEDATKAAETFSTRSPIKAFDVVAI